MGSLNCESSGAVKTIKDICIFQDYRLTCLKQDSRKRIYSHFFPQQGYRVYDEDDCAIQGEVQVTGIYKLDMDQEMAHVAASEKNTQRLWDRRLDRLCSKSVKFLAGGMATGMEFSYTDSEPRAACIKGKHSTVVFKPSWNM
jgi:hypothetical protein